MKRSLSAFLLSVALVTPVAIRAADDHDRDEHRDRSRYYDPAYRDYHEWNEHEDHAYRQYLKERNHEYKDWAHVSRKEQNDYWKWRHKHPDSDVR